MEEKEKIKELYENGKNPREIAKELHRPLSEVRNYLRELLEKGSIELQDDIGKHKAEKKEKKEKIRQLYNAGETLIAIKEATEITDKTLKTYLKELKQKGLIEEREEIEEIGVKKLDQIRKQSKKQSRKQRVAELYNAGKTPLEIAEIVKDVKFNTIYSYLRELDQEGKVEYRTKKRHTGKEEKQKRAETIERLYGEGRTRKEIAQEIRLSYQIISTYIKKLSEGGNIEYRTDRQIQKARTKELYESGKTQQEIEQQLDLSTTTIYQYLKELSEEGEITYKTDRQRKKENNKAKTKELYELGKTQKEIASELRLSRVTIYQYMRELEKEKMRDYMNECRKKIKACIQSNRIQEAKDLLITYIHNEGIARGTKGKA